MESQKGKIMWYVISLSKSMDMLEVMQMANVRLDRFNRKLADKLQGLSPRIHLYATNNCSKKSQHCH
jgi:hypothetical protein